MHGLRRSTIRNYALAVAAFCRYVTDPAYGWAGQCQARFGTHPVQVCHELNTAIHVQQPEGDPVKRAFTFTELQAFFDYADAQVTRSRGGGRKGWLAVFRDATMFKAAYGFGLRRTETVMLDLADLGTNPHAAEFDGYGLCQVRHGKGGKGSPPKRRSVLTVWPWLPEVLGQWIDEARPLMAEAASSPALWPSERGPRVGVSTLNKRFDEYRDALGMEAGLDWPPRGCSTPPTWSRCWQTGASTCPRGKSGGWSPAPPERLSLPVLAALCDIFEVTPAQLIAARAENIPPRKAASCGEGVTGLNALRPRRAHLKPPAMTSPRRRTCARCGDNCGGSAR